MNGRIYDAALGRFLSADPLNQDIYNTQTYNAYSYVLNNPLSYTDPTGMVVVMNEWIAPTFVVNGTRPDWREFQPWVSSTSFGGKTLTTLNNSYVNNSFSSNIINSNSIPGIDGVRFADTKTQPTRKKYEELTRAERMAILADVIKAAKAQGDRKLARLAIRALSAESQWTTPGIVGNLVIGLLSGFGPTLERAVATQLTRAVIIESSGVRVAAGMGQNSAEAVIIRSIGRGEKVIDLIDEAKSLTFSSGNEIALVKLADGERALVMGGPGGISFENMAVKRLFGHTHPYQFPATGPSIFDIRALRTLEQQSSYLLEHGLLTKFGSGLK